MSGRLKDFRRIVARYDNFAANSLDVVHLVAPVCY